LKRSSPGRQARPRLNGYVGLHKMTKAKMIAGIALVHMIFFSLLAAFCMGQSMKGFDTGTEPPLWVRYLYGLSLSQLMPAGWIIGKIGKPLGKYFPGLLGYVLFYINSIVLVGIYWHLIEAIRRKATRTPNQAL
jgi:hypothetical protein